MKSVSNLDLQSEGLPDINAGYSKAHFLEKKRLEKAITLSRNKELGQVNKKESRMLKLKDKPSINLRKPSPEEIND